MKLVSTAEMIAVEKEADANGLSYSEMMENAGRGLAETINDRYSSLKSAGILGLVGSGNNGGDTLVALALLSDWGWKATAYIVRPRPENDPLMERLESSGGDIMDSAEDKKYKLLKTSLAEHGILMDGILGTGIKLPLRGTIKEVLEISKKTLNRLLLKPIIVAVDCPSGVDSDTGEASPDCLAADLTVTMAAIKRGLLEFPANDLLGEVILVGIGLAEEDKRSKTWRGIKRNVVDAEFVRSTLPERKRDAHKGTFGTAFIISGSVNYTGAVLLSGKAAYRAGAGLVTLGVPSPLHNTLAGHIPEATWVLLPHEMGVLADSAADVVYENLGKTSAMLLGPGFGLEDATKNFMENLFSPRVPGGKSGIGFVTTAREAAAGEKPELPPLVIDADGLKLLAKIPEWQQILPGQAILTPHPGEMAELTGQKVSDIQAERVAIAEKYAKEWGHIVVLKGANTVIADPAGRTSVIPVASAALSSAGSGDVLAGIIVGLLAQGMESYESAVSGAWIHAQSGLKSAEYLGTDRSVIAGDLISSMVDVLQELDN
ncbi:MAG: NAD(P)H-hydrate dehydratase [Chloroflexota bacterium]|nr:MAG: NAD(P)H-hydrate dehydratase [Chloroflexota bacterium]